MPGPQVDQLVVRILQALPHHGTLPSAIESVRQELETLLPGLAAQLTDEIAEASNLVEQQFARIEILHNHSVISTRPRWYFGPLPTDLHWPAVKGFLRNEKHWPQHEVDAIDEASTEIVSLLEPPRRPDHDQFSCRGLVVGHVQSGKTANMTAVMAKALDAGYDTVIVLAGLTNKLRMQTQLRLFNDLVMRNPLNWQVLTPNEMDRDFQAPAHGGFLSHSDKAQLAVIKKNVSPLRQLKLAIERTLPAVRRQLRILVIDDECDQASVNSARGELDMTVINQRIRELLSILPAATYVGYTATPFANVLINPYQVDGVALDDLYPRDFITALPPSPRYFGTKRLFGRTPADPANPTEDEDGLDMIRYVSSEDEALLQPPRRVDLATFQPTMPESLETAILYFLACCAARLARGDASHHMTMLIHTSSRVLVHERVADLIRHWVQENHAAISTRSTALGRRLSEVWEAECGRLPSDITDAPPVATDKVFDNIPAVLERVEFPVENGASTDRIDYTGEPRLYIVVGGSILARGLTLEGLMVSYFLRGTSQYDTLLQMGRWFGYRPRYEDLPRIWMPEALSSRFRALAAVEDEIREDIEQYRLRELGPLDIAVRIRAIPGMAITAANRMRAARKCAISYWGTHRQTIRFAHRDQSLLSRNWAAGAALIDQAQTRGRRDTESADRKLWRGVPLSVIRRFVSNYEVEATHGDMRPELLIPFLDGGDPRLASWNVGIVESSHGPASELPLGVAGTLGAVRRAKLREGGAVADIKALMSRHDVMFDCPGLTPPQDDWEHLKSVRLSHVGQIPLLLLYPINRMSTPSRRSAVRAPLDAAQDVLGIGLVFPGSVDEGGDFVSVELRAPSHEDLAAIEEDEMAQSEAAGVT